MTIVDFSIHESHYTASWCNTEAEAKSLPGNCWNFFVAGLGGQADTWTHKLLELLTVLVYNRTDSTID